MSLKSNIAILVLSALMGTGCEIPETRDVNVAYLYYSIREISCEHCGHKDTNVYLYEYRQPFQIIQYKDSTIIRTKLYGQLGIAIFKNDSTRPYGYIGLFGRPPVISRRFSLTRYEISFFNALIQDTTGEVRYNETDSITMNKVNDIWQKHSQK